MNRSLALLLTSALALPGIASVAQGLPATNHDDGPFTSKLRVETPVERLLPLSSPVPVSHQSKKATANNDHIAGKVAPGLIAWRKDFATACNLSESSGKPVLLFQMMGKLDDEFC